MERSLELLHRASSPKGYLASPDFDHYAQVWVRDAAISSLGALASGDVALVEGAIRTLDSMAETASELGQIAAVIHLSSNTWDWAEGGAVDATAFYVILAGAAVAMTGDDEIARRHAPTVSRAMSWLRHQDVTGSRLISAAPSTDWMDSSLVRSGRTLNLNSLYHWAAVAAARVAKSGGGEPLVDPQDLSWRIDALFWPTPDRGPETLMAGPGRTPETFPHAAMVRAHAQAASRDRDHYVSHVVHSHFDEHCDVLANLILICTGVADSSRAESILNHLERTQVDQPYPSRVWTEPVDISEPSSMFIPGVEVHLDPMWRNPPGAYHNGASWPFVGGFHVVGLALARRAESASRLLSRLASANQVGGWGFHEWIHGTSGEAGGVRSQTWNAGAYVLAQIAVHDPELVSKIFR